MNISIVSSIPVSSPPKPVSTVFVPDNAGFIAPVFTALYTDDVSSAATNPISPLLQDTTPAIITADTEVIAPPLSPVNTSDSPVFTIDITDSADKTPISTTTEIVLPPFAAFFTMAGESIDIRQVSTEDSTNKGSTSEVSAISPLSAVFNNSARESTENNLTNRAMPPRRPSTGKRARDYLRTINKRAQATDREFQRQHLPYRFKVLTNNNENVLIDLSIIDGEGKILKHVTRDVTNDNFGRLMDDITTGKGLLIDNLPQD